MDVQTLDKERLVWVFNNSYRDLYILSLGHVFRRMHDIHRVDCLLEH